jgi:hypothetical protein
MNRWIIKDWYGNLCFAGIGFASFDDAEAWLCEQLDENYELDRGEYDIQEKKAKAIGYYKQEKKAK